MTKKGLYKKSTLKELSISQCDGKGNENLLHVFFCERGRVGNARRAGRARSQPPLRARLQTDITSVRAHTGTAHPLSFFSN